MKERNVTIVTTSMNLVGPFNSFIAFRGLISMHVGVSQRLPFFKNTLDILHSIRILNNWILDTMLEFTQYDIYRALRPGGLFCLESQLNVAYLPMLELDRGIDKNVWYFSALLEKPMS
uniref:ATRAD3 n=1 Tax=Solanum tuberosum TaxID=4113 RepID=M1BJU9_SOLTU